MNNSQLSPNNAGLNSADPLAQLKDIHLPDPVSWWPPSTGLLWLILGVFILCISIVFIYHHIKKRAKIKKQIQYSLLAVEKIQQNPQLTTSEQSQALRLLLRKILLLKRTPKTNDIHTQKINSIMHQLHNSAFIKNKESDLPWEEIISTIKSATQDTTHD